MMTRLQQAAYHASGWTGTAILVLTLAGVPAVRADEIAAAGVAIGEKIVPMVVSITVHKDEMSAPATSGVATAGAQVAPHNGADDIKTFVASGFVIDPSGLIVTNYHVVENAYQIRISFWDGSVLPGDIVSADYFADIALVQVHPAHPLAVAHWGDSQKLELGDQVVAAGNPFGLGVSLSAGIISALDRNIHDSPYDDFIQTDAAINHGNSGGPLCNMNGDVIGVDSDIISPVAGSVGVGFALPSSTARFVIDRLRDYGWVRPSWIGVKVQQITPDMAEAMGLQRVRGSIVALIWPGGPADRAGLQVGDIVETFDGQQPQNERALLRDIAAAPAGKTITLAVRRGTAVRDVTVTTAEWPREEWDKLDTPLHVTRPNLGVPPDLGLTLSAIADSERSGAGLTGDQTGVRITLVAPDTDAARRGIVKGDVIERVQDKPVSTPAEVMAELTSARAANRQYVMVLILPVVRDTPGPKWFALQAGPVVTPGASHAEVP
jgi:serine protease Do